MYAERLIVHFQRHKGWFILNAIASPSSYPSQNKGVSVKKITLYINISMRQNCSAKRPIQIWQWCSLRNDACNKVHERVDEGNCTSGFWDPKATRNLQGREAGCHRREAKVQLAGDARVRRCYGARDKKLHQRRVATHVVRHPCDVLPCASVWCRCFFF